MRTSKSSHEGGGRRSEPIHIREIVAEIWAVLETRQQGIREDSAGRRQAVVGAAQPAS